MCTAVPVRGWWVQCGKSGQEVSISHLSRPLLSAPAVCSVLQIHALVEQRSVVITHSHVRMHTHPQSLVNGK